MALGLVNDGVGGSMAFVIEAVLAMVLCYSAGYMAGEAAIVAFYGVLNAFGCSMMVLVMADNLAVLFLG